MSEASSRRSRNGAPARNEGVVNGQRGLGEATSGYPRPPAVSV